MVDKIYMPELGLDGTIEELINWAWRYTDDYSDEALDKIAELAKERNLPDWKVRIPILCKQARQRENAEDDTLPYEVMKHDLLEDGKVGYSETKPYGEVEIVSEGDKVIVSIIGVDDNGSFAAAGVFSTEDFLSGDENWLENVVGSILYYSKEYEQEDETD